MSDMPSTAPPQHAHASMDDRRGVLAGDRACIACGFNLSGQTIVKEPHYGMFIVRCPECGVAASLQEYPLLGKWAGRLGAALVGVWVLGVLAGAVIAAMTIWGFSDTLADDLSSHYAGLITEAARKNAEAQGPNPSPATPNFNRNAFDEAWWDALPPSKFFADSGGWAGAVHWRALWMLIPEILVLGAMGVAWSVLLSHLRWRGALVFAVVVGMLGVAFMLIEYASGTSSWYWNPGYQKAKAQIGWPLSPIGVVVGIGAIWAGMLIGRPIARGLVLLFLPPRLRAPLSFLWITDGKPLPRP